MHRRAQCPVCEAPAATPLLAIPYTQPDLQAFLKRIGFALPKELFADIPFQVHACARCGGLFQAWVLEEAQLPQLYGCNDAASRLPTDFSLPALVHLAQDALLMRRLLPAPRPQVLDYGMGWGRFALLAQAFGCDVSGVEVSTTTRAHAQRHGITVLEEAALAPASFDFVLVDQVLEHVSEPAPMLRRLAATLKPGGLLLVGVPGHRTLAERLARADQQPALLAQLTDRDWDALCPTIHVNLFNTASLRALGERAGLRVFRPPFWTAVGAGMLWDQPRQWSRTARLAWKYAHGTGTRLWFQRPA